METYLQAILPPRPTAIHTQHRMGMLTKDNILPNSYIRNGDDLKRVTHTYKCQFVYNVRSGRLEISFGSQFLHSKSDIKRFLHLVGFENEEVFVRFAMLGVEYNSMQAIVTHNLVLTITPFDFIMRMRM
jgi:hypothetical protein